MPAMFSHNPFLLKKRDKVKPEEFLLFPTLFLIILGFTFILLSIFLKVKVVFGIKTAWSLKDEKEGTHSDKSG